VVTLLLIIHSLLAVALLGALTHQAISVWWPATRRTGSFVSGLRSVPSMSYTNAIILLLGRRDQRLVGHHQLIVVLIIEIAADHHPVAIFVQSFAKTPVGVSRGAKDHVEHDQPRTRGEKFVHQQRPKFA